jgi:hypothetical protein
MAAETTLSPRLKPGDKIYHNKVMHVIVRPAGHERVEDFTGNVTLVPRWEIAPATRQGSAKKSAKTFAKAEHNIFKDLKI